MRNKEKISLFWFKRNVYHCFCIALIIFFACGLLFAESGRTILEILRNLEQQGYTMIYVWIYFLLALILYRSRNKIMEWKRKRVIVFLLVMALIPRMLLLSQRIYIPTSDFRNYYEMGVHLISGDKAFVSDLVTQYQIPKFGGLAVFMAIVAKLFSTKLIGFQIANVFFSSIICILIYLCIENYDRRMAFASSILFAVYPGNIISSQVTTNHHIAIMFAMLGMYLLIKIEHVRDIKKIICAIVSGICFAFSDFGHPSAIILIIAVSAYGVMGIFAKEKRDFTRIRYCTCVVVCYFLIVNLGIFCLQKRGIVSNEINKSSSSYLPKIVVGFNEETRGGYSAEDGRVLGSLNEEEQQQWCKQQINERVFQKSPKDILLLFRDKVDQVWFEQDSYAWWYYGGMQAKLQEDFENSILSQEEYDEKRSEFEIYSSYAHFDWLFLRVIYVCVIMGLIMLIRKGDASTEIVLWMLLGWTSIHLLIEVQARYRYLGMPYIFIIAGIGVVTGYDHITKFVAGVKKRRAG